MSDRVSARRLLAKPAEALEAVRAYPTDNDTPPCYTGSLLRSEEVVTMPVETVAEQILKTISGVPGCPFDEVLRACPEYTWNQIFLEIDRLTRRGDLILKRDGPGLYSLYLRKDGAAAKTNQALDSKPRCSGCDDHLSAPPS
jgi:hypothetical protein